AWVHRGHGGRTGGLPGPGGGTHRRALADPVTAQPAAARQALDGFLDHLANERRASPRTLEAYGFAVRRYIGFLEQHRAEALSLAALGEITAGEIRAWLAWLRTGERPLSPRSMAQAL